MPLTVEIIRSDEQLAGLSPEWNSLLDRCQPHCIFLTPEWLLTWWEVYGEGSSLFFVAVREHDCLVGLLPTYLTGPTMRGDAIAPRQLRFLGTTAVCSDHLDGLAAVGYEDQVIAAWQSTIREHQGEWDSLEFADLDKEGLLYRSLTQAGGLWGAKLTWTAQEGEACPFIRLPVSWEAYLTSVSAKTRREIRHDRRTLGKLDNVVVAAVTDAYQLDEAMTTFIHLHKARRQSLGEQKSCFTDVRYARFHSLVSRRFAERGFLRLWLLEVNRTPVAARYQFAYRGRVHDYMPGHDPQWDKYSVGLVLLSHCVEQAILSGAHEIDLLRGAEGYKSRWCAQTRGQATLTALRRFSRAWVHHQTRETLRRVRRTTKQLLPDTAAQIIRGSVNANSIGRQPCEASRFVPFFPSTAPRHLVGPCWNRPRPFPFDEPRAQFYYFARNGIWHAIDLLGLGPNDEVLMPAYNNGMEIAPFQYRRIPLRFVHVDRQMVLDLKDLTEKITASTRVVYVIHYLGFPQPIQEIQALCQERGLVLFEDCALAFGSSVNGRPLGSFGDLAIFCLAKFLPVPNGGVLVLNNSKLGLPPPTVSPSPYSVASQLTTKLLDHAETHGGPWARRMRGGVTRVAQATIRYAGLQRVDSGVMQFLPDKTSWGMAKASRRILARVDYDAVYWKRRENFLTLREMVRGIRGVTPLFSSLPDGVAPLFLPVLVGNNQAVCEALIARRISAGGFWSWFPPGVPAEEFPDIAFLRRHVLELQVHQDLNVEHLDMTARHLREVMVALQ